MQKLEPSQRRQTADSQAHYIVGQDTDGHWLAIDPVHRAGGIFRDRDAAIHFAAYETGHATGAVEICTTPLRLAL